MHHLFHDIPNKVIDMKGGKSIYCPICDKKIGKYSRREKDSVIPGWVCCPKHGWIQESGKSPQHLKFLKVIFTIQVGSFIDVSHAEALREKLKKRGYSAYVTTSKSKMDEKPHIVSIGRFNSREKAENLCKKIKKTNGLKTFVIPTVK